MFDSQQSGEIASFSMIFGPEKSRQPHFQMSFLGIPGMPSGQVGSELSIKCAGGSRSYTGCFPAARSSNFWSLHVLGTEADSDYAGRNPPQNWPAAEQLQRPRKGERFCAAKDPPDNVVLYNDLESLRGPSRKIPPLLDGMKLSFGGSSLQKFWAEYVRSGHCVLNCEIDSYPSDRRHGVRCIADTEQSRPRPS